MRVTKRAWLAAALAAVLAGPAAANAQGVFLPGAGAVQGGMAGASTATPADAIGALYWNPAAIGRLGHSEVSIGGGAIYPDIRVASSVPQPAQGRVAAGETRSDSGLSLAPTLGVVYAPEDSPLAYGLGLIALGGGGVNFPGDPGNPIVAPVGPLERNVIGPIYSSLSFLQLAPTVAYKLTDRLVVGAGPTIGVTLPSFDPAFFAGTNGTNADGVNTFPTATHARPFWGGGFRVGFVYSLTDALDVGFGYTSPQWQETWKFYARDGSGNPETLFLKATLPAVYSWGVSWRGTDRLLLSTDIRYFDYKNADLFGTSVRDGGLGWDSVFAVALGGRYQLTDRLAVQAGYQYNTNPLANSSTLFNVQSPAITQNLVAVGVTTALNDSLSFSLGYSYAFENSVTGTAREIPGAGIRLSASAHTLLFNLQVKFGARCAQQPPCRAPACDPCPAAVPVATLGTPAATP